MRGWQRQKTRPAAVGECNDFLHGKRRVKACTAQPAGIGPVRALAVDDIESRASRLRLTEFGYQPVGISPATRPAS